MIDKVPAGRKKTPKKKSLGKGLDALLGAQVLLEPADPAPQDQKYLSIDKLQRGVYQPRQQISETSLADLVQSISAQGIIQPIIVRPISQGHYEIVAGERRWRAAQLADLQKVPVIIRKLSDETVMCMALIENIQREDLNPLDTAEAIARLIEEFAMTHEAVAKSIGCSRAAVSNLLRLLALDEYVKDYLRAGDIEMGHARSLLALTPALQGTTAKRIIKQGLSVRATEQLVKQLAAGKSPPRAKPTTDPDIRHLQDGLAERLGAKVMLQQQTQQKGCLKIYYHSLEELEGILAHIK